MYLDRFALDRPPFEETTSPRFCYETAAVQSICDAVRLHVRTGSGLVLIEGPSGSGRTMLGRLLAERMPEEAHPVSVSPNVAEHTRFAVRLGAALQVPAPADADPEAYLSTLLEVVRTRHNLRLAVIIDDAEQLSADDLAGIDELLTAAQARDLRVTFVLLATDRIHEALSAPQLARLAEQLRTTARLHHLAPHETGAYMEARLKAAGSPGGLLFTPGAIEAIARIANGRMRQINALARQALIRADELELATIDADQIPVRDGESSQPAPPRAAISEPAMDPQSHANLSDLERMERLLARFAELSEHAPLRLAELEAGLTRLQERAEVIVRDTTSRVEQLEDSCARADTSEASITEQLPHIERLTGDAKRVQQRLDEFVRKLGDIDAASEERIALLLSGLESATAIHEKLESAGQQVSALIDEARHTAMDERESLVQVFDELSARREELSATIDALRRQRQTALEDNEAAIGEMVQRCRSEAAQACTMSAEALAEARRTVEANRTALTEQAGVAGRKLADARDACLSILEQVHRAQADIEARHAALMQHTTRFDERMAALAAASERSTRLTAGVDAATERLSETLSRAEQANGAMGRNIDTAAHLRDNCVATLERLQAEGVAAIEEKSTTANQQLNDALSRFEALVATEHKARSAAEDAVRTARTAVTRVQESEAKLADAQAAAINIEATASAALTAVQQQIKRFENSVEVIVKHGVDRARSEIQDLLEASGERVADNAQAVRQTADEAIERVNGEIHAALSAATAQITSTLDAGRAEAKRTAAETTEAITNAGNEAGERLNTIATCGGEHVRRDANQAAAAITAAVTNAMNQVNAKIATCQESIDHDANQAAAAITAAVTNA
ncbi:MAG TPA: AAA family ATPase, partial [Phycisphaerae bacterium]|nr:AAA family ATPase [Phycisphaerae bacterium]